jgi:hypothetical protein
MTEYWINTKGKRRIVFEIKNSDQVPVGNFKIMFGMVQCSWFTKWLFSKTKINLKAKDKFAWLRN